MRNRIRQRENRRKKAQEKHWLNPEGYLDLTPYYALRNIQQQESKKPPTNKQKPASL